MTTGTIFVLDPTAPPRKLEHAMAPRKDDIRGQCVGFLWNGKPNGDTLFDRLEQLLREKYEIKGVMHRRKDTASIPTPQQVIDELAQSADAVIVGLAD